MRVYWVIFSLWWKAEFSLCCSTFKKMYFNAYEIKISYTLIQEVAVLGYSASMIYLCGVDAVATVSHSSSKYFPILSLSVPCVGIRGWEHGKCHGTTVQQLTTSAASPMLVKHLRGSIRKTTAHTATSVYCILNCSRQKQFF